MTYLVNNAATATADTDPVVNLAPIKYNMDPLFVQKQLLSTVYAWAGDWGGASIQVYISGQLQGSQYPVQWFPAGAPITANGLFSFSHRFGQIKAEVSGATSATLGLFCDLFGMA